jgi:RNA polymerase sigma-70 factor (ECF subfamily)
MPSAAEATIVQLNQRYRTALMAFFVRRIGDRSEAEDLTQEVFARLANRSVNFLSTDAYIFQMAANLLRDRGRRLEVRERFQAAAASDQLAHLDDLDPSRVLIGREGLRDVAAALKELSSRTRTIFLLYRLENMKKVEIASLYEISVSGVQKHLNKAMDHLTRRFGEAE